MKAEKQGDKQERKSPNILFKISSPINLLSSSRFHFLGEGEGATGIWTQSLTLDSQARYCMSQSTRPFCSSYLFIYWRVRGLNSRASCLLGRHSITWATLLALFLCVLGIFRDRVSWTACLDWLRTTVLLISASWVARRIDVNLQCSAGPTS
jgi:hypothetical protein